MTRTDYEQHLRGLGSWAELMPPWLVLEQRMQTESEIHAATLLVGEMRRLEQERDRTRTLARTLLKHTSLTPSQVRELFPEDAQWLLADP